MTAIDKQPWRQRMNALDVCIAINQHRWGDGRMCLLLEFVGLVLPVMGHVKDVNVGPAPYSPPLSGTTMMSGACSNASILRCNTLRLRHRRLDHFPVESRQEILVTVVVVVVQASK